MLNRVFLAHLPDLEHLRRVLWRLRATTAGCCAMGCWVALAALPAWAEKADRTKPVVVEADQGGSIDLQRQVLVYTGNVVVVQGTMQLRAERIEMRQTADGHRLAVAWGQSGKPASWRQKREGLDEIIEGSADRIEFDGKADTLRLLGKGVVRRLRGAAVADEISGNNILWENGSELLKVEGGSATPGSASGRVRAVLSPRVETPPAPATPPAGGAAGTGLVPSLSLSEKPGEKLSESAGAKR
jgi:lipopolysaccharide export system protein LptA